LSTDRRIVLVAALLAADRVFAQESGRLETVCRSGAGGLHFAVTGKIYARFEALCG
jgi:ABC-type transport system involved in cytochrome c biogenesis permease component